MCINDQRSRGGSTEMREQGERGRKEQGRCCDQGLKGAKVFHCVLWHKEVKEKENKE